MRFKNFLIIPAAICGIIGIGLFALQDYLSGSDILVVAAEAGLTEEDFRGGKVCNGSQDNCVHIIDSSTLKSGEILIFSREKFYGRDMFAIGHNERILSFQTKPQDASIVVFISFFMTASLSLFSLAAANRYNELTASSKERAKILDVLGGANHSSVAGWLKEFEQANVELSLRSTLSTKFADYYKDGGNQDVMPNELLRVVNDKLSERFRI